MFSLRIHSISTNNLLTISIQSHSSNPNPKIQESRGVIHLYRNIIDTGHSSSANTSTSTSHESTLLFVVAVPSHISSDDFRRFCGSYMDHIEEILMIRNDGMEDRYSVLIRLVDRGKAVDFYRNFNGRKFLSTEAEVCHILFTVSVEHTEFAEVASTAPTGFTELPTCPVCLERLDQDTSGILTTLCDHSFQCSCISKWTDSSCLVCRFCQQQPEKPTCAICGTLENLWICVICGFVGCGRYKGCHAIQHWRDTHHCYSLDLETQRVWDYVGDGYVHRLNQSKASGKLAELRSSDGDCGNCERSEDSEISGAVVSSHIEATVDEYNHLLASQLENQRQYYEKLLLEAKSTRKKCVSEAIDKAVNSKLQEIEDNIKKTDEEKKHVASENEKLMKEQEMLRKKMKEIEERDKLAVRLKDEQIVDLEEQIRDLTVYVQAQSALNKMGDPDGIQGGTVLPLQQQSGSTPNSKRRSSKTNRRRP
ncbi:RING-type E3 ubiquitin transferase [Ranunculus cassubicifolius]